MFLVVVYFEGHIHTTYSLNALICVNLRLRPAALPYLSGFRQVLKPTRFRST